MKFQSAAPGTLIILLCLLNLMPVLAQESLILNDKGYFEMPGLNVMVFSDTYPEGHQSGVSVIQHGVRVASNGDLRLEVSPGQWAPAPKPGKRAVDIENQTISQLLWYPDTSKNRRGFNPIIYPDLVLKYKLSVNALEGSAFRIRIDLEEPLPEEWVGNVGFNLELFPGDLFGVSYMMDQQVGIFPTQPNGPVHDHHGEILADAMAVGKRLVVAPENDKQRLMVESSTGNLELWDGRTNHNNGWFIVRTSVPAGVTNGAVEWTVTPTVVEGWMYEPVIQVSQLGYHPAESKKVVIEQDGNDMEASELRLYRMTEEGRELVSEGKTDYWGEFLRYNYYIYDFTEVTRTGLYQFEYRSGKSHTFQVSQDVYDRHAWQPVLEYYLPVMMCHMRINEKYRVWHDACHLDDALMATLDTNHFDGYRQGSSTLTEFDPLEPVPGLNVGGWHDAGDYDLRVESQIGTVWKLALMIEEFGLDYDATMIDQDNRLVEIHVPDGKSDALQQIEHGLLAVLGGYRSMGRLYRGIICSDLRQYVMLGDAASMTDNQVYNGGTDVMDDRWVFTEENPGRALQVAAGLAAASRVLKESNPELSKETLETALALWETENGKVRRASSKIIALSELILATGNEELIKTFIGMKDDIISGLARHGWAVAHVIDKIDDKEFRTEIDKAVAKHVISVKEAAKTDSPYGVPYRPRIWGAGWNIQQYGVEQYFFHKAWPESGFDEVFLSALHFVLGVHPGENNSSFASGIGSESALVAYGTNRVDWSFIPGGVASGTALIRPDFPEFKVWPFFWQQTEYVMGGGSTNYMFLVMAAQKINEDSGK